MFSKQRDASKVALVGLCKQLQTWDFTLLDCQVSNPHLVSMGATKIERDEFRQHLKTTTGPDHWQQPFQCDECW
jgi:leucyl/phenylalanyl-tRNA--protein transferase